MSPKLCKHKFKYTNATRADKKCWLRIKMKGKSNKSILTKYFWLKNLVCSARTTESSDSSPSRCIRSRSSASLFFLASSAATRSLLRKRSPVDYKLN